jgi:DNA recombination protein RmuC
MVELMIVMGLVSLVSVAALVWALMSRARAASRAVKAETEAAGRLEALEGVRRELEAVGAARDASSKSVVELSTELARLRERLSSAEEMRRQLEADRAQLKESFKGLASEALSQSSKDFMTLAKTTLEGAQKEGQAELEKRRVAVEGLVKPIRETLAKTEERLVALTQQVGDSREAGVALKDETAKLVKALSRPEIRGQYGEIQLRRVAELAGMTSYCDFTEQVSVRDGEGNLLRPDMVVTLPNERVIAVDAKTNTYAYIEAVNAANAEEREAHLERFARHVSEQAKKLAEKRYWSAWEGSPDFVVMFVPGDHFIDAALSRRPELLDEAAQRGVILASPATLIGLLRAVAVGWREDRLAKEAEALFALGRDLHERVAVALEHASKVGAAIEQAVKKYNQFVGSMEGRVLPQLRKFEDAGVRSGRELVELPEVEVGARLLEGAREGVGEG